MRLGWALARVLIAGSSWAVVALRPPAHQDAAISVVRATAATLAPFHEAGDNLLRNASFETPSPVTSVAADWLKDDDTAEYALDMRARYGQRAQRITKSGTTNPITHYSSVAQRVDIIGGHTYALSVEYSYVATDPTENAQTVGIVVFSLNKTGAFVDDGTLVNWGWPQTQDWVRRSVTFKTPAQASVVVVQFRISINGSLWLDGAMLKDVSQ